MTVPEWVQDAIFYQIFPDRFADGDPANNPPNVKPWEARPTLTSFHGGDLRGVIQRFDYLLDLGINAIYFTPIFLATSNHRYNATDYFTIDPKLGTLYDFQLLLDVAHRNGVRIVLDGVFNHCGRGFYAFVDVLENQDQSAYKDWFHIKHFPVDAYGKDGAGDYLSWWNIKSLPKFNTSNRDVRQYLFRVARYWMEQGADGWRLDVPNEIDDDSFWAEFRQVVKQANPEAYILGEIWDGDPRWVGDNHFDGLMNYPVAKALLALLCGQMMASRFLDQVEAILRMYPRQNAYAMYQVLGSHDTERILTMLGNDFRKLQLAYLFAFAYPGAPAIYYGDEVGIEGGKDPDCRRTFPWDERQWKPGFRPFIKSLIAARKSSLALRRGDFHRVMVDDGQTTLAFARVHEGEKVLVILNASDKPAQVTIPIGTLGWEAGMELTSILDGQRCGMNELGLKLELPGWGGRWLTRK